MPKLVLVRHGQSLWNLQNRFTGWIDVPLTEKGKEEAYKAGELLKDIRFNVAYTSALSRAQETLKIILEVIGLNIPVIKDQALNERHYGDLQGLNKDRARAKYGAEIVHLWRRSYDIAPPGGESLKDTANRTIPFLERAILGDIAEGNDVLVVAHGNSNRSIVMYLEKLTPEEIIKVELDTGTPIVYELDKDGNILSKEIRRLG
ncbi:2,3-bisphosphoglycerate-dependent phosphoglycerate mutase [Venenivibrio stagnispumantis]|uniref:2,3-bisphosphoglycerate-dependent phosphoglycerate mutase n=1 Tax=Venenivibrio stagnispumantis TaxID=407998 RepID=A0AA46ADP9_9AQUI|nr:2,3-bisphosphoglycerate-dependent phosphoglycerate mutase [Venenivibrio stagnispumantis]MCW4573474.1 2,3-bisphosphoglycerate-dependent phosphoglycerate mutase [Venenivibrio stagnispumantis]SMP06802.1 2,3-bisphosphoglycerate-dependent phosphoglycerate mutase [Venenivibrio stagnispumantis]